MVSAYAGVTFANLPYGAVGYSYGSLTSLIGVGALESSMNGKIPAIKSVVAFSSPGIIPGLMDGDTTFSVITKPTMMVTGTADVVDGYVPDAKAHQDYFEGWPEGGRMLLVARGGTHRFVGGSEAGFSDAWPVVADFLKATVLEDAAAKKRLDAAQSTKLLDIRRR